MHPTAARCHPHIRLTLIRSSRLVHDLEEGLVAMEVRTTREFASHQFDQALEFLRYRDRPVRHILAADYEAMTSEPAFLPVER